MTPKEIFQIAKEIVKEWPYSQCEQVDTWAVVSDFTDIMRSDLGLKSSDFDSGAFWSRKYVDEGRQTFCRSYPMIVGDMDKFMLRSGHKYNNYVTFGFQDKVKCTECGDCGKGITEVKQTIQDMILMFDKRLHEYWVTEQGGQMVWSYKDIGRQAMTGKMSAHITRLTNEVEIYHLSDGVYHGQITYGLKNCPVVDTSGFKPISEDEAPAIIKCKTCG